ncbi:MAG TPA: hypothetical protein EYG82_00950 [Sulfurovum sp.]|nr:hypothetical protein [Sulfurovum sp.]
MEVFLLSISLGYIAVTIIFYITMIILAIVIYNYLRKRLTKHTEANLSEEINPDGVDENDEVTSDKSYTAEKMNRNDV